MKPASGTRKPYTGHTRSLVLALDVGTTFSGVSYAILEPGEVPKIHGVTRFPGQEHVAGNSKIPTIMYYDRAGQIMAAGAEAESASIEAQAEDEEWTRVELFKLRLRPKQMKLKMNGMRFAPLPRGKTAVDVFGDFLSYLFRCTRSFIVDTHANGPALWRAVEHDVQFVLSHPNGWEGAQQSKMRRAAVYGGLIPDTDEGKARIRFVTEGEASLHACVLNGLAADVLQNPSGHGFIVADAGGGTLDISSYAIRGTAPLVIEEIAPPDCVFAGSVFVSRRAREFFEEKLKASKYGTRDALDHITKRFDETTKRLFRDNKELQFVHFGSPLDKDMTVGIRGGQLKLTGAEVAALFEPSIDAAVASIRAQIEASGGAVKSVWLVGGFAASPWLFSQLQERLARFHVTVSRPDTQTSKAVADGAVGFYCDHHVSARMSKFMYGVEYLREFDAKDEDHLARKHRLFELPSGPQLLPDAFDCILARGVRVKESTVFSRKYCTEVTNLSTLSVFEVEIWCYRGGNTVPKWIVRGAENFSTLCYVRADLSPLTNSAQSKPGKTGKMYWNIVFSIEIHFGLTEFRARIKWTDNGQTKYGPASIVYNESGHRAEEDEPDESPDDNVTVLSSHSDGVPQHHHTSRPPSRDSVPASRHSHATLPPSRSPTVESARPEFSRSSSMRSTARSDTRSMGKGKGRETVLDAPEITEFDRSVNVSGRSADSGRSGSTRLAEQLSSVWGSAKHQSPAASLGPSVRSSMAIPRNETTVATPREMSRTASQREVSKAATPREISFAATPRELSRTPTVKELSRNPTPREVSKAPTPREPSRTPTPHELSMAPSLQEVSAAPTPRAASKAPTPKETSKAPTPRETSRAPTPHASRAPTQPPTPREASKAPTPEASKAPTPRETSKAATPVVSKAPTPKAGSKAATPKTSKAGTPKATSNATTPKVDLAPLADPAPLSPVAEANTGTMSEYISSEGNAFVPPPPTWMSLPPSDVAAPLPPVVDPAPAAPAEEFTSALESTPAIEPWPAAEHPAREPMPSLMEAPENVENAGDSGNGADDGWNNGGDEDNSAWNQNGEESNTNWNNAGDESNTDWANVGDNGGQGGGDGGNSGQGGGGGDGNWGTNGDGDEGASGGGALDATGGDSSWFPEASTTEPPKPSGDLQDLLASPGPASALSGSAGLFGDFLSGPTSWGSTARPKSGLGLGSWESSLLGAGINMFGKKTASEKKAEEERERQEATRKAEEEAAQKRADEEAAQKRADEEVARQKAEEEEAARNQAEEKRKAEEAARAEAVAEEARRAEIERAEADAAEKRAEQEKAQEEAEAQLKAEAAAQETEENTEGAEQTGGEVNTDASAPVVPSGDTDGGVLQPEAENDAEPETTKPDDEADGDGADGGEAQQGGGEASAENDDLQPAPAKGKKKNKGKKGTANDAAPTPEAMSRTTSANPAGGGKKKKKK